MGPATTYSAREFNQDLSGAKRAANAGPVVVTDRGAPAYVLLAYDDYERLVGRDDQPLVQALRMDTDDDVEFDSVPFTLPVTDL